MIGRDRDMRVLVGAGAAAINRKHHLAKRRRSDAPLDIPSPASVASRCAFDAILLDALNSRRIECLIDI